MHKELENLMLDLYSAFLDSGRSDFHILMVTEYTVLIIALHSQNVSTTTLLIKYLHFVIHIRRDAASQRLQCTDGIETDLVKWGS
jgi:hypothetical protein